jgi:hypothetical protein
MHSDGAERVSCCQLSAIPALLNSFPAAIEQSTGWAPGSCMDGPNVCILQIFRAHCFPDLFLPRTRLPRQRLIRGGSGGGGLADGGSLHVAYQSAASRAFYGDVTGSAAGLAVLRLLLSSGLAGHMGQQSRPPVGALALDELLLQLRSGRVRSLPACLPACVR